MKRPVLLAIALGWEYALLDEIHQSLVPGRISSLGDWTADAAGTVAGVLLFLLLLRLRQSTPEAGTRTAAGAAES
jgi:VanZ family protein